MVIKIIIISCALFYLVCSIYLFKAVFRSYKRAKHNEIQGSDQLNGLVNFKIIALRLIIGPIWEAIEMRTVTKRLGLY